MDTWAAIAEERASILGTFERLTPAQWDTPSLCGQWTVRDVLGHLIIAADAPVGRFVVELAKAGGSFDKANDRLARAEAEHPTDELVARYGELVGKRSAPPGFGPEAPLTDVLLHSLDVRVPLGLRGERPPERYAVALDLLFSRRAAVGFVPRGRPALRWVATDHPWARGAGAEVHGTTADLALAASGRAARADSLTGPGRPALDAWLHR